MRRRIRHSLGVISLVSVYAEASDLTVKDAFYVTLKSVVDPEELRSTFKTTVVDVAG